MPTNTIFFEKLSERSDRFFTLTTSKPSSIIKDMISFKKKLFECMAIIFLFITCNYNEHLRCPNL